MKFVRHQNIFNKNILILGLGISGFEAAQLALCFGAKVNIIDTNISPILINRANILTRKGAAVHLNFLGKNWHSNLDLIIISPGIKLCGSLLELVKLKKCPIISELEFGSWFCNCPIIAITGTNGKTTTVEMINHCLRSAGKKSLAVGNNGYALSKAAENSKDFDYLVAEVSSFQLEYIIDFSPALAIILNISEDHLDRYSSYDDYSLTKMRLFNKISDPKQIIINVNLLDSFKKQWKHCPSPSPKTFSAGTRHMNADYFLENNNYINFRNKSAKIKTISTVTELNHSGNHNIENVLATLAVCKSLGLDHTVTLSGINTFSIPAHRQELVIEENGIRFINDSKSTNPDSLIQALKTFGNVLKNHHRNVILIAGGRNKKMNFEQVISYLRYYVKSIYLIGETKDYLASIWGNSNTCFKCTNLTNAVKKAAISAVPGDIILFSPGCSSCDMFSNYEERGNLFITEVKRITKNEVFI